MNSKTALVALFFLIMLVPLAHGQRIGAFVSAGATASQIEGDELKGFKKWGFAGSVGAFARLSENDRWHLSIEAGYARRGAYESSGDPKTPYHINLSLDYVDIPLTLFFKDPYGGIYIGVGPVYSRLVRQPHDEIAFNPDYFVPDISDMEFIKNDFAIAGEIRFPVWRGLMMSLRYQYSLIPVKKDWLFTEYMRANKSKAYVYINDCYNSSVMIRLLWQFGTAEDGFSSRQRR
ncbi:MAG: porin family protein [Bacteroidales bacterium]|nr:porin family protein [Bacteroidales bacterium]